MLNLSKIARASEWWEYKLPPVLAIAYATAQRAESNLYQLAPRFCILLLGIVIGAAYVSIINDITDIKEDLASGKQNRLSSLSPQFRIVLVLLPLTAGFFFQLSLFEGRFINCALHFLLGRIQLIFDSPISFEKKRYLGSTG